MKFIRKISLLVCALLIGLMANCQQNEKTTAYTIKGKNWDEFNGHTFKLGIGDTTAKGYHWIKETTIKNGKIKIKGKTEFVRNAFWRVYDDNGKTRTKGFCILEPGTFSLDLKDKRVSMSTTIFEGGKYNTIIFKEVQESPEVKAALKNYFDFEATLTEADTLGTPNDIKATTIYQEVPRAVLGKYNALSASHKDPYVRMLAMYYCILSGEEMEKIASGFPKEFNDNPEYILLESTIEERKDFSKGEQNTIGSTINFFVAKDLNGKFFNLTGKNGEIDHPRPE